MSAQEDARTPDDATPVPPRPPAALAWARENLFSSWGNAALTLLGVAIIAAILPPLIDWVFVRAIWEGDSGAACRAPGAGACWPYIDAWFGQFVYYQYDPSQLWRVDVVFLVGAIGLAWLMIPRLPAKLWVAIFMLAGFPLVAYVLLSGGWFGLPIVPAQKWGGFLLTLVISGVAQSSRRCRSACCWRSAGGRRCPSSARSAPSSSKSSAACR